MRIKNRVAIVGLAAGVLGGGVAGIALASPGVAHGDSATTTTTTTDGAKSSASSPESFLERALAPLVENGTITQEQADAVIEALHDARPDHVGIERRFGPRGLGVFGDVFDAAAKALGVSTDDLRAALRDGKSIADVAKEKHVDISKLVDAMVAEIKADVDQAVKDGKLTRKQADEKLQALRDRLTALVNGDFPKPGAPGGFFGHGPGHWHRGGDEGGSGGSSGDSGDSGGGARPSSTSAAFSGTA